MFTPAIRAAFLDRASDEAPEQGDTVFIIRESDLLQATAHVTDDEITLVSAEGVEPFTDQPIMSNEWALSRPIDKIRIVATGVRYCNVHKEFRTWDAEGKRARCASHKDDRKDARAARNAEKRAKAVEAAVADLI